MVLFALNYIQAEQMDVDLEITQEIVQTAIKLEELIAAPFFRWEERITIKKEFSPHAIANVVVDFSHLSLFDISGIEKVCVPLNGQMILLKDIPYLTINLSHNSISSIPAPLLSFKYLKGLQLDHNNIARLPASFFDSLSTIVSIELSHNQLVELPAIAKKLTHCRNINLSHNRLTYLPESFGNLNIQASLFLHDNYLEQLPDSLYELELCFLDISHNELTEFAPRGIGLTNLRVLDISHNNLVTFPDMIFPHLTELSISHNQLVSLPINFSQHAQLNQLNVSHNCIQSLPTNFNLLTKLTDLNASHNRLIALPRDFSPANLSMLNLSHNVHLRNLPDSFGDLKNLIFLNLNHCLVLECLPLTFRKLTQLKTFYLIHVPMFELPDKEPLTSHEEDLLKNTTAYSSEILALRRKKYSLEVRLLLARLQAKKSMEITTHLNLEDTHSIKSTKTRITYGLYYVKTLSSEYGYLSQDSIGYILEFAQAFIEPNIIEMEDTNCTYSK